MAPYNYWFALLPGLSILYLAVTYAKRPIHALFLAWAFGFGYFGISMSWIGNALLVQGNDYAWAWPLSVTVLPAGLSFFPALGCYFTKKFTNPENVPGYLGFAASLALAEFLRGHLFTGFPWNLFGYTWAGTPEILQTVFVSDVYGLTLLTILWMTLPGFLIVSRSSPRSVVSAAAFILLSAAASYSYGFWRVQNTPVRMIPDVTVRLVQPNIPQEEKWDGALLQENYELLLALSESDGTEKGTTYIVWPESALSYLIMRNPLNQNRMQAVLQNYNGKAYLMTGALQFDPQTGDYFNSLLFFDQNAENTMAYNKSHLVPFGEYIPFQKWIPLEPVTRFTGFRSGNGPRHFTTPEGLLYSPLICYEIIFPGAVTDHREPPPDFMVNVTNDAWYGDSPGPRQHLIQAVFRAVEEGIPVIRSANTGISAMIDPLGHITYQAPLSERAVENLEIPVIDKKILFFQKHKTTVFLFITVALLGFSIIKRRPAQTLIVSSL